MSEDDDVNGAPVGVDPGNRTGERTLVLVPVLKAAGRRPARDADARLAEAVGLAAAIDLDVLDGATVSLSELRPATLFGTGKIEEIAGRVADEHIGLVVVDHALTPVQQRNLERALKTKVIDRTGLILEIFGERAHTREGALQVELAHLNYQRSRLVRSWTHLERQRGGFGFLGGPGETQIEADRRVIRERVARIERELEAVVTRRRIQRRNRRRSATPLVALVGYTNAGKSTLFNALTRAGTFADDQLFATLDPTLRRVVLPRGITVILSDTVGFVSDLPTALVAAFRATLEEVSEADIILHVRDIAHPDSEAQARDVAAVLSELGINIEDPARVIEVWNKIDLLPPSARPERGRGTSDSPEIVAISALTGEGQEALVEAIERRLSAGRSVFRVELSDADLGRLHHLYELGEVLERDDRASGATVVRIRVPEENLGRFRRAFPAAEKTAG